MAFGVMLCVLVTATSHEALAQSAPLGGIPQSAGTPPGGAANRIRSRMPKAPDPIPVAKFDKAVARQHREADLDRDGYLTIKEVRLSIDRLADEAIAIRFAAIDTDRNRIIEFEEFADWQKTMGSRALSDLSAASINQSMVPSEVPFHAGDDFKGRIFGRMIRPLNASLVAQADANLDGKVDVLELQTIQRRQFAMLDANSDGFLVMTEFPNARGDRAGGTAEDAPHNPLPPSRTPSPPPETARARIAAQFAEED
ncbi:EF-hand domain-containing protein [Erythrobacter sp. YT30]|uniref:EF-hand domain-containing protein n=1 Tax=Erythrobacter sp. YT30 TaxID=1735012 RepID=UPI00076CBC9B|nr:EF-hand domain-containing protein [Erythrobacter sp. YT30]KWV91069.1 hypothetical protein AUC45_07055 [Erythrobacter sp. YT30]